MERLGGRMLAVSVDPQSRNRKVVERNRLAFPILSDQDRKVTAGFGLLHKGGGPGYSDIPVPAHVLVDRDGRIIWRHIAIRIQDRPDPKEEIRLLREKLGS